MRELNETELCFVAGGNSQQCTPSNSYGGINDTSTIGRDIINAYEGVVAAMSHIIERVANAL